MSTFAINRLWSGLTARYHVWHGRRAYRAGRLRAAGRHLDRALARGCSSFGAYLLLGKVAYRERDMQRAMDCFRMARRTDPARFALEGFPKGFIESLATQPAGSVKQRYRIIIEPGSGSTARSDRGPGRNRRPLADGSGRRPTNGGASDEGPREIRDVRDLRRPTGQADSETGSSQPADGSPETTPGSTPGSTTGLGDFSSPAERERTRGRPLLRPGEWADIDWDVEARKLFGE